jgi:dipeptidyl aminopeptidase/acylaminoacyl peptidase
MKRLYQASEEQSVFDVVLQHYGSLEDGLGWLMEDNPTLINEAGLFDLSKPVLLRDAVSNAYVIKVYDGYIPVSLNGMLESEPVFIFAGDDVGGEHYLFDNASETVTGAID